MYRNQKAESAVLIKGLPEIVPLLFQILVVFGYLQTSDKDPKG